MWLTQFSLVVHFKGTYILSMAVATFHCLKWIVASVIMTHQSDNVPRVLPPESLAVVECNDNHNENDDGAYVGPQVALHCILDWSRKGEHTHHWEGEQ